MLSVPASSFSLVFNVFFLVPSTHAFRLATDAGVLSFTLSELALEAFFPADVATANALQARARKQR